MAQGPGRWGKSFLNFFGYTGSLYSGLSRVWRAGTALHHRVWASHCGGFSCCRARALGTWASVVATHRLSSCGTWAWLL